MCLCVWCVSAAAPVWVSRPQDSYLEEGKPGYLHCHAQANPEPEVTWFRNNLIIMPEVRQRTRWRSVFFQNAFGFPL